MIKVNAKEIAETVREMGLVKPKAPPETITEAIPLLTQRPPAKLVDKLTTRESKGKITVIELTDGRVAKYPSLGMAALALGLRSSASLTKWMSGQHRLPLEIKRIYTVGGERNETINP